CGGMASHPPSGRYNHTAGLQLLLGKSGPAVGPPGCEKSKNASLGGFAAGKDSEERRAPIWLSPFPSMFRVLDRPLSACGSLSPPPVGAARFAGTHLPLRA